MMKYRLALLIAALVAWCGIAPEKASAEVIVVVHHRHHGHWIWRHHHRVWVRY